MSTLFGSTATATQANNTIGDLSKDVQLTNPPEDSISDLAFSTKSQHLAVASWDKKVRIYEITATGATEGKAYFETDAPVLSCHWSSVRSYFRDQKKRWLIVAIGWQQSRGCRSRQASKSYRPRSWPKHSNASRGTRPAHSLCTILHNT